MNKLLPALLAATSIWSSTLLAANDLSQPVSAPGSFVSPFIITTWNTGEGLPINDIQDLKETPDGYLWIGTYHGLVRFDGVRFESFLKTPTGRRYGPRISPLELDGRGRLWVAPDQPGLMRFADGAFTEVLTNGVSFRERATSLCNDGTNGMYWVDATGAMGWFSTDNPERAERFKVTTGGGARWHRDFAGGLWLTTARSARVYEDRKFKSVHVPGSGSMVATPRLAGGLWVARDAQLQFVTADGKGSELGTFPWKGQSRVMCLLEDSKQRLWIGTVGHGLFCYANGQFIQVTDDRTSIVCLLEDHERNLWVGTRGGGLSRVREREFFLHNAGSGLRHEFVRSLAEDKNGRLWMLTAEGGLGWLAGANWHQLGYTNGWPGPDALCLTPSQDGSIWISTLRRGLWRWKDGKFTRTNLVQKGLMREPANDLLEDKKGRLWMVTDNSGLFCWDGAKLTGYSTRSGLPSEHMRQIIEDEAGVLWAGDWEGGITRFLGNRWQVLRKQSGHMDAVRSIVAHDGALWIGTSAGGLLRFKEGQTSRIGVEQGLPDACIQQLLLDGSGSLWGATPHKLFRLKLKRLNAVADGKEQDVEAIVYGRSDGLPDVSFANWSDPRCWQGADGRLWFATANGAIHVQPANLRTSAIPSVVIEQTLIDGKPARQNELQQLRPGPGRLEFKFTAPCLTAPERVRFRYQLSGVEAGWVDAGTTRSATYASLPAGKHVFRVLASSPDGTWSSEPATVSLAVHPYFWQTSWFLAGIGAVTAGGTMWGARRAAIRRMSRRIEKLRHQSAVDRERARIAQDIHDELGANLTSIGLLADMGNRNKANPDAVARELQEISVTARESVAAMDAIVWALNPRNDSLDHFANYIAQFTRDFFRPANVRTRLDLPANLPAQPLAMETRHQLFLIVKECFNNVARHAEASEVKLEISCENGQLHLVIADNGKGLSEKTVRDGGNGLGNLKERIERLGGSLKIESEAGKGTKLSFSLPVRSANAN